MHVVANKGGVNVQAPESKVDNSKEDEEAQPHREKRLALAKI
jgi:hypothetical protein